MNDTDTRSPTFLPVALLVAVIVLAGGGLFLFGLSARDEAVSAMEAAQAQAEAVEQLAAMHEGLLLGEIDFGDVLMLPEYASARHHAELKRLARDHAHDAEAHAAPLDEEGTPLFVEGRVVDDGGAPIAGAQVYAFQTDARGWYGVERSDDEANAHLWTFCVTDEDGAFRIHTIRPGHYAHDPEVPAHVHFDVRADGHVRASAGPPSLFFADDPKLTDAHRAEIASDGGTVAAVATGDDGIERVEVTLVLRASGGDPAPR